MIWPSSISIMNQLQTVNYETIVTLAKCALQIKSHLLFGFLTSF